MWLTLVELIAKGFTTHHISRFKRRKTIYVQRQGERFPAGTLVAVQQSFRFGHAKNQGYKSKPCVHSLKA